MIQARKSSSVSTCSRARSVVSSRSVAIFRAPRQRSSVSGPPGCESSRRNALVVAASGRVARRASTLGRTTVR